MPTLFHHRAGGVETQAFTSLAGVALFRIVGSAERPRAGLRRGYQLLDRQRGVQVALGVIQCRLDAIGLSVKFKQGRVPLLTTGLAIVERQQIADMPENVFTRTCSTVAASR